MRKVFLEDLPRWESGLHKGCINWIKSAEEKRRVKFIYDDIEGELPILKIVFKNKNKYIETKYNNKYYNLNITSFTQGNLGTILNKYTNEYRFKIEDIVRTLKILEKIKIPYKNSYVRGYKYICLKCGNIDNINEYNLKNTSSCNVCTGKKVLKGINDLWTTHPHVAKLLKDKNRGYELSKGSSKKEIFICPDCGYEKLSCINDVVNQGFSCKRCSDNVPYPEKFMFSILNQTNLKFITQLNRNTCNWSQNKRYDFFIPSLNCIIETHGLQHYENNNGIWCNPKLQKQNDRIKEKLAKENGIEHYIVIDSRKSNMEYIKNNILNSKLAELLDLSKINWIKCHEYACSSLVKQACDLWNSGIKSTVEIGKIMKIARITVIRYLKLGVSLKLCDYDSKKQMRESGKNQGGKMRKNIVCVNTKEVYKSAMEVKKILNIDNTCVGYCCKGKQKSAGKHPITGEPLKWMYYEDYIKEQEKLHKVKKSA